MPLLKVENLSISFRQYTKAFQQTALIVVRALDLSINPGEMVAIVGSSGSGKSLLAHAILGILPYNASMAGRLYYDDKPLDKKRVETLRGKEIVLVPQGITYLDPLMKAGRQIHNGQRGKAAHQKTLSILSRYGLDEKTAERYPFELSGGMARRVLISSAVYSEPRLVIADEPTPGLHIQAARRVLGHFREMAEKDAGVLLITHDLELARQTCDRIVVFYAGYTIEEALARDFDQVETLRHPYTRALWQAMPQNRFSAEDGRQPAAHINPEGCIYAPRCKDASDLCRQSIPYQPLRGGYVRCIRKEHYDT